MKNTFRLCLTTVILICAASTPAQIQMSIGNYSQNFDTLAQSGNANPWNNNGTLLGWYAQFVPGGIPTFVTNYRGESGAGIAGALYSYGLNPIGERALGSIASGTTSNLSYGVRFTNNTASTLGNINVVYTGEQWRNGSNTVANSIRFSYRVSPSPIVSPDAANLQIWTPVASLDFTSPIFGVGLLPSALDGNLPPNRSVRTGTLSGAVVPPGAELFIRWLDQNDPGNDPGLAVDDLQVAFQPVPVVAGPEFFFPVPILPPTNGQYHPPWYAQVNFGTIVISNVQHRTFTQGMNPPPLGQMVTENFGSAVDFSLSTDSGATFSPATGNANVTVQVTHSQDSAGVEFYQTEMLQLDLVGPGFMLRESPTLQSTGQTSVRPVADGYLIASFFDVFTELSTDGGLSWLPALGPAPHHVELSKDPRQSPAVPEPTPLLPPPNDHYVSPQQWHALFAQGIVISNVSHRLFTESYVPPPVGGSNTHGFSSQLDLDVSTDGGLTFQTVRTESPVTLAVANIGSSGQDGVSVQLETEMLFLGATLPGGQMIRESPTRPSRGGTAIIPLPDGTYLVHSFFDIFVDLSVDSGTTWTAASNGPVRMELRQQAPEVATTTPDLPLTNSPYVSPAQWHALYAAGIIITNVSHDRFTQQLPPPPPGGGQVENFGSTVTGQISADGGATFQPFAGFANASVQVTSHSSLDNGTTRFFDTEMLSLDLNSPAFMIRESPSKASLGKTSVRTTAPGDHHISSFFDVFTEVSLDGGLNWLTSISRPATMSPRPNGPTPTPIVLTCSSNITVTENTPGGAIVTYLSSASGACIPPPVVSCFPLSGSIFPVGTTIVTCTASDTCGNSTNCTFKITVVPEYFNPTNSLPPSNTVYISPAQWHVLFAQGIIIRDVRHRFFTQSLPPPPLGATQVHSFNSRVDFEYSNDGGATFQPASANVPVSVRVTHTADTTSGSQFDTEMLSLNLVSGNIRLRESPTLASTGRTTVRAVPGGYMIGSFFDVFTEVSLDGGATWQPAQEAAHVEMRNDPRRVATVTEPTQLLPPPNEAYVSPAKWHALYAQGIVIRDVRHKLFTGSLPPPPAGGSNVHTFNSTLDLQLSTDGGNSFQAVRASAPVQVSVRSVGSGNSGMFETEMLQLDISGGTLPASVRLRESPTRPSRGATQIDSQPDGTQRIGSFFDIFAEVSTDGGNTWNQASNGPVRLQVTQQAPETPASSQNLPLTNSPYVSPAQWHAAYANGIYISNVTHRGFTQNYPPPPPGGTNDENFDSTVDMQVSLDSGQTFVPASCTMSAVVRVISRPPLDSGSTRTFDTEMLALDISGGSLPNGIRLRESPTRQSLGRTSVRPDPSGVGYRVSSFFDIFTDVSVDGGNTWLPATTPPASMSPRLMAKKRVFPNANMPPTNGQYISPKQWHALYANGIIISNVSHKRFLANFTPPPPRSTNTHNFGSQVDFLLKLPGQTFQPMTANADCQVSVANTGFQGSESVYQTEMLALNLSGGSLPPGVMIRESPTRRSTGEARGSAAAGGGSRLGSFFDIFTEVSLDGGNTWSQADSPGSMELHLDPGSVPTAMMQPRLEGGHLAVSVATQTGLQYLLQYKSEIEAPTWTTLSITPGNGQSQTLTDTSPLGSRRYYRVEVQEDDLQADGDWSKPLELP